MTQPLRIVFAGTPEFAAQHLQALLDAGKSIVAVYTQPDRPAGRGQKLMPSPVKQLAMQHDIPVLQPQTLRDPAAQAELAALQADLMVVVAYGLILPQAVRLVLPSLILALVTLLKDSTLGYVVSYNELQFQGKTLVSITRYLVQTYLVVSVIYILINFLLTRIALALDARMKARAAAG